MYVYIHVHMYFKINVHISQLKEKSKFQNIMYSIIHLYYKRYIKMFSYMHLRTLSGVHEVNIIF